MKSTVAVLKTTPRTVLADYGRLMRLAGYQEFLPPGKQTFLKVNLEWQEWYPSASTEPWQLDGVIRAMIEDGYLPQAISVASGRAPGPRPESAEEQNGLTSAAARHDIGFTRWKAKLDDWVQFAPEAEMMILDRLAGEGDILVPGAFLGNNIVHLPTLKTHALTVIGGSAMSCFNALLDDQWHKTGIHRLLVDLLALQKELCGGVFTVSDGTISGDGPGPCLLVPYVKDYIIAGADPVAVDAVAARMMGFNPMEIDYIRMATERGVGNGEISEIDLTGDGIAGVDFRFGGGRRRMMPMPALLREYYWYPFRGRRHVGRIAETGWGQLLQEYLPEGAGLDVQGKGKGPLMAMMGAGALFGLSAARWMARLARRGAWPV
ncbi:MAG: DUF362 domain-containing protein [Thermoleophilia bacterium]|nr:DUF362 domain-containing protein [Thermoleophilia bacterium]